MTNNESHLCLECRRPTTTSSSSSPSPNNDARFSCRICLESLKEPVVTKCGHLFCWPCLYEWLEPGIKPSERLLIFGVESDPSIRPNASRRVCPACKMPCSVKNVVNIYVPDVEEAEEQNQVNHTPRRLTPLPPPPTRSRNASSERHAAAAVTTSHHNAVISSSSSNQASGMDPPPEATSSSQRVTAVRSSRSRLFAARPPSGGNHSSRPIAHSATIATTPTDVPRLVSFQTPEDGVSDSSSVPSNLSLFTPVRHDAASPLTEASHHPTVSPQRASSGGFENTQPRDTTLQRSPPSLASVNTATPFTPTGVIFRSGQAFRSSLEQTTTTTTTTTSGGGLGVEPQGIAFALGSSSTIKTRRRRTVRTTFDPTATTTDQSPTTTEAFDVGGAHATVTSPMATYASSIFVFGATPPVPSDESSPSAVVVTPPPAVAPRDASLTASTSTCLEELFGTMLSLDDHNESQNNVPVPFAREWGLENVPAPDFSVIGDVEQPQAHVMTTPDDAATSRDTIRDLHNVTPELVLPSSVESPFDTTCTRAIFVFGENPESPEAPFISSPFGNVGPMPPFVNPIQASETIMCSPNHFESPRSSSGLTFSVGKHHLGSSCKKQGRMVRGTSCRKTRAPRMAVS